jgi:hypothetical protein
MTREKNTRVSTSEKAKKKEIKSEEKKERKRSNKQKLTRERKKAQWSGKRTDVTMDPPYPFHPTARCFCCLAILFYSQQRVKSACNSHPLLPSKAFRNVM